MFKAYFELLYPLWVVDSLNLRLKTKYQGVKEFYMACISCYCKIMVFSPLKLEVTYCHSSKGIKF